MRLAMMTLAGCSISFSDEMQFLPASRIRMMQTCLPPGSPAMKPLDLYDRTIPSIWHVHCANDADDWEVVALFNFENAPETRSVDFGRFHMPPDTEVAVFEFWEQKFLGVQRQSINVTLPPQSSRILSLRRMRGRPQIIGTDLHQLQGYHEIRRQEWDENTSTLSGECERMPGIEGRVIIYVPPNFLPHFEFPLNANSARVTHLESNVWAREIRFQNNSEPWTILFDRK
jgi:hypothetical protein